MKPANWRREVSSVTTTKFEGCTFAGLEAGCSPTAPCRPFRPGPGLA